MKRWWYELLTAGAGMLCRMTRERKERRIWEKTIETKKAKMKLKSERMRKRTMRCTTQKTKDSCYAV